MPDLTVRHLLCWPICFFFLSLRFHYVIVLTLEGELILAGYAG